MKGSRGVDFEGIESIYLSEKLCELPVELLWLLVGIKVRFPGCE